MLLIIVPVEKGYNILSNVFVMLPKPNKFSKLEIMYQGIMNMNPTLTSNRPHIRMKIKRRTVFTLDRPPCVRFFWKISENQSAIAMANTWLIIAVMSMIRVARGELVTRAISMTWLVTEPKTM